MEKWAALQAKFQSQIISKNLNNDGNTAINDAINNDNTATNFGMPQFSNTVPIVFFLIMIGTPLIILIIINVI